MIDPVAEWPTDALRVVGSICSIGSKPRLNNYVCKRTNDAGEIRSEGNVLE